MIKNIFLIAGVALLLSSCYSGRKAKLTKTVNKNFTQQEKELAEIKNIEAAKKEKLNMGEIDSTINKKIDARLTESKNNIEAARKTMDSLTASTTNKKLFKKNYKSILKSKISFLRNNAKSFNERISDYGLIADVLTNAKQTQFDLATFFGLGEYLVPADKLVQAKTSFTPLIDTIIKFAGKYASIAKSGTIVLKGFTDATGFNRGTVLYYKLANELKQDNPTNEDLNLALSKLRTQSISKIVNQIVQDKQPELLKLQMINVEIIQEGRGEEMPNKSISNYTANDVRRRIVLFFWNVLPK